MKTVNEMKLCVPSKSCNEAFARCVVSAFVMSLDPTVNELSDLKTAVSEAVTNCIVHGYRHQSGKIYINGKITSENKVIITIRDKGCGISDIKKAMEPLFTTAPEEDRAGQMSGSGPTVFGIFPDEQTALGCQAVLKAQGEARQVYITETFN